MIRVILTLLLGCLLAVLYAPEAAAHIKWFVSPEETVAFPVVPYRLTDIEVLVWIGLAVVIISGSVILDSRLPSIPIVETQARRTIFAILRVSTGMSLLLTAHNGAIIAPHYLADGSASAFLLLLEAGIGLLFMINKGVFYASILLILLFLGALIQFDWIEVIEYLNILGVSLFLLFNHCVYAPYKEKLKPYSVSVLRIFTGISLVTLGFSEKLLFPEYGKTFLFIYQWNFLHNLGFEAFSDRLFILSAGVMEVVFGIILIFGTTTRLNILVLAGLLITSNTAFLVEGNIAFAITEVIGHLPLIATAIICVFFGSGQKLKLTQLLATPIPASAFTTRTSARPAWYENDTDAGASLPSLDIRSK